LLLCNCVQDIYVLREPKIGENPGAVAFGLFIFNYDDQLSSRSITIKNLEHFNTTFAEVLKTGNFNFVFSYGETKFVKKAERKKISSASNILLEKDGKKIFFIISGLDPNKDYVLRAVEYGYTIVVYKANGATSYRNYYVTLPIDPIHSREILNMRIVPGKIRYAGIYGIKEEIEKEGTFLRIGETKKGILLRGEEILEKSGDRDYQQRFFGDHEMTGSGGEAHFRQLFLENHRSGYWGELINKDKLESEEQ